MIQYLIFVLQVIIIALLLRRGRGVEGRKVKEDFINPTEVPQVFDLIRQWHTETGWDFDLTSGRMHPFAKMHWEDFLRAEYEKWRATLAQLKTDPSATEPHDQETRSDVQGEKIDCESVSYPSADLVRRLDKAWNAERAFTPLVDVEAVRDEIALLNGYVCHACQEFRRCLANQAYDELAKDIDTLDSEVDAQVKTISDQLKTDSTDRSAGGEGEANGLGGECK